MSNDFFDPAQSADYLERLFAAVPAFLTVATGITNVTWDTDPEKAVNPLQKARLKLSMSSQVDSGVDELRYSFDTTTSKQYVSQNGLRIVTLQIVAESFSPKLSAWSIIERVRSRTHGARRTHTKELRDANVSLNELGKTIKLPTSYDNRVISACAADLTLNVAAVLPEVESDWVEATTPVVNGGPATPAVVLVTENGVLLVAE